MKCPVCGNEVNNEASYCPSCGERMPKSVPTESVEDPAVVEKPKNARVWDVFAKLGFGLGLAGLICSWIYGLNFSLCIPALVFSILGNRSFEFAPKAKTGKVLAIIGLIVSFIATIIWGVIIASLTDDVSEFYF